MWLICRVVFIYIHICTSLSVNLSHFYLFSLLLLRTTCHELYNGSHAQLLHTKWPQMRTTLNPTLALDAIEFSSCKRASIKSGWGGDTWDYINYLQKNIFQIILINNGWWLCPPTIIIEIFCLFLLRKCSTAAFLSGNWSIFERLKNMMSQASIFVRSTDRVLYKPF